MTTQPVPGYVQGRAHTFGYGDPLPPQVVNLLQDDVAAVSAALTQLGGRMFLPGVFTADYTMPVLAGPDTVGLTDNVDFLVGGVLFNTHDCVSRVFAIPDWSTRYLRVEAAPDCGLVTVYETQPGVIADPLARSLKANFILAEGDEAVDAPGAGGGATTKASMRLLKAVKGGPGSTPTITFYANKPGMGATSGDGGLTESDLGRRVATLDAKGRLVQTDGMVQEGEYWLLTPLAGPLTVNVNAATGNNATADGSPALPFKTVQAAVNFVAQNFFLGPYNVTIQIAAGTYAEGVNLPMYMCTTGSITLSGAGTSTIINPNGVNAYGMILNFPVLYSVRNMQINAGSSSAPALVSCVYQGDGRLNIGGCTLLVAPSADAGIKEACICAGTGIMGLGAGGANTITITASSADCAILINGGNVNFTSGLAITGTLTGATCSVNFGGSFSRQADMPAISGAVKGYRYIGTLLSLINVQGGGANFFPGTVAGSLSTGAQYA